MDETEMYQTSLLLKLNPVSNDDNGVRAKVKLARQIQGAKYLEVHCDLSHVEVTLGFKCDLVDASRSFTNIESHGSDKLVERVRETTAMLLFKGGGYHNTAPISPSKSVIDEFVVDVYPLKGSGLGRAASDEAFIQVSIFHTIH